MSENANEQRDALSELEALKKTFKLIKRGVLGLIGSILFIGGAWTGIDKLHYRLIGKQKEEKEQRVTMKTEFVKKYGETAVAHVANGGVVKVGHEVTVQYTSIMKLPPTDTYTFYAYIGNENGVRIADSGSKSHPEGAWPKNFYAADWFDYSMTSFTGNGFRVPERLEPGNYTMCLAISVTTPDGTFTGWLKPIPFTLVENNE